MNEVKTIHLGRQQFTVAVDAHKALRDYLEAIHKQAGVQEEVVKEVEIRMAELLLERGVSDDKVVLLEDVTFLKEQLGQPADFADDNDEKAGHAAAEESAGPGAEQPKKLFRDPENAMIAGVASGLAAYTGVDVLIIRIIFVGLMFASGAGILLYIMIWILAPEAKTRSDRLHMQGKAVTVGTLKEVIDRADVPGASQRASLKFGSVFRTMLILFGRLMAFLIGSAFVTIGVISFLWGIAAGVYLLIHGVRADGAVIFPLGAQEVWLVVLAIIAVALFGFLALLSGLTMTGSKWRLPGWLTASLIGVMLITVSVGAALGADRLPKLHDQCREIERSYKAKVEKGEHVDPEDYKCTVWKNND